LNGGRNASEKTGRGSWSVDCSWVQRQGEKNVTGGGKNRSGQKKGGGKIGPKGARPSATAPKLEGAKKKSLNIAVG